MINILPPELKDGYRYARSNVTLRKWVIMFGLVIVGLGVITTYGLLTLQQSNREFVKQIAVTEDKFKDEKYDDVQKRVEDISGSFKLVIKVLSQEILFSKLITQIGASIPENAVLTGLNINQTQGAIDITAMATNYTTATQVQVNLADPSNKIFSKADIVSVSCETKTEQSAKYPCVVNIRALFGDNNPYLFINSKEAKQ